MALYDRDYYREEPTGYRNWVAGRVTLWLIAAMVAIFIMQVLSKPPGPVIPGRAEPDRILAVCGMEVPLVLDGEVWRFFTAPWLHNSGSLWPILFSMMVLYFAGRSLEDELGGPELLCFYIAALLFTQTVEFVARFTGVENPTGRSYGSVGPVTAVLVLQACRHPYEIWRLIVIPVPLWVIAAVVVVVNLANATSDGDRSEPALPLAGAAFGFLYHRAHLRLSAYLPASKATARPARKRPTLRVVPREDDEDDDAEPVTVPIRREARVDEQLEAKVDLVLEKVARHGKESLTSEENEVLLKASEVYRKRKPN